MTQYIEVEAGANTGITIVRAILTCPSVPMQWDTWTDTGAYAYLRYRHGRGTVCIAGICPDDLTVYHLDNPVVQFFTDEVENLQHFCDLAGLTLALREPEDRSWWE